MSQYILISADSNFESHLRSGFDPSLSGDLLRMADGVQTSDGEAAIEALKSVLSDSTDVVAVGPDVGLDMGLRLAGWIDAERPDVSVLLVTAPSAEVLERALRAGIRDVVSPDASASDLYDAIHRAEQVAARRRGALGASAPHDARRGRVIVVVSPKGGSGKTTVATNLALGLSEAAPGQAVIVDMDLQFGDVGGALRLMPESSTVDALRALKSEDALALKVFLTPHPSGVFALCAPSTPEAADQLTADDSHKILDLLASEFRYVVVDTSAGITEHTLAAIEAASDIVLVCSMDVPSVRSLRKELDALDQLGMVTQTRHLVLNRADSRVGLTVLDIEATVGMSVDVSLPSTRAVPLSLNQGTPVLESDRRSPLARRLLDLVARFADQRTQSAPASSGWLKRKSER